MWSHIFLATRKLLRNTWFYLAITQPAFTCSELKNKKHQDSVNNIITNFEQITHMVMLFPLLTLNK